MERYDEALARCNRAIELDPGYAVAIAARAGTYRDMKRYGKALTDLKRSLKVNFSDKHPRT